MNKNNYYLMMTNKRLSQFKVWASHEDDVLKFINVYNSRKVNIRRGNLIKIENLKIYNKRYNEYCRVPIYEIESDAIYFRWHQETKERKLYKRLK